MSDVDQPDFPGEFAGADFELIDPFGVGEPAAPAPAPAAEADREHSDALVDVGPSDTDAVDMSAFSVEALLDDLERVTRERDTYLDDSRRLAAEFTNFRRQTERRQFEMQEQAASRLVEQLLPVLDACDAALAHGRTDVEPIYQTLVTGLQKSGLSIVRPIDEPFDPNQHEAVIHEDGDGGGDGPIVVEVLRTGYLWNGRVLRAALVKVRG